MIADNSRFQSPLNDLGDPATHLKQISTISDWNCVTFGDPIAAVLLLLSSLLLLPSATAVGSPPPC